MAERDQSTELLPHTTDAAAFFNQMNERYRRELLVHCYRMLGSVEDAEDALQETFLRAWRHLDSLRVLASMRAWLYKIATNVALDMLARRKPRLMPSAVHPPADPHLPLPDADLEAHWLGPLPETFLADAGPQPEHDYERRETVNLAFLTVLQRLPGRQRAALILCDVMDWKAQDAADILEMSLAAVNSALQRARATLRKQSTPSSVGGSPTGDVEALLAQYVRAWETADSQLLLSLLRADCVLTMPPVAAWFQGRAAIGAFIARVVFAAFIPGSIHLVPTRANGSPAFALYRRNPAGGYQLQALHVLTLEGHEIARVDDFLALDEPLYRRFRLPRPDDR